MHILKIVVILKINLLLLESVTDLMTLWNAKIPDFTRDFNKASINIIKHLMTDHKGNSEFCFPEKLNIEVEGKQNSLFPEGPVIKCFVIPPDSKIEKAPKKIICLRPLQTLATFANLSGCQNQPVLSKRHDNSLFLRS